MRLNVNLVNFTVCYLGMTMNKGITFDLSNDAMRLPYNHEAASFCDKFECEDTNLDVFFQM